MKNIGLKLLSLLLTTLFLSSCIFDSEEVDYGKGPIVVQFHEKKGAKNFLKDENETVYDYRVSIEYFGKNGLPLEQPVIVKVGVVNDKDKFAKEGVEFEIPNKEVVIPAGKNVGELLVKVKSANLDSNNPKNMVLKIIESSQIVSDNRNITSIKLQAICVSKLEGNYVYTTGKKRDVILKSTGVGTYEVSCDDAFGANYSFNITDVCGNLTVTGGFLKDTYGISVSGKGTVNELTGEITIYYTVDGYLNDRKMIMKKIE